MGGAAVENGAPTNRGAAAQRLATYEVISNPNRHSVASGVSHFIDRLLLIERAGDDHVATASLHCREPEAA